MAQEAHDAEPSGPPSNIPSTRSMPAKKAKTSTLRCTSGSFCCNFAREYWSTLELPSRAPRLNAIYQVLFSSSRIVATAELLTMVDRVKVDGIPHFVLQSMMPSAFVVTS